MVKYPLQCVKLLFGSSSDCPSTDLAPALTAIMEVVVVENIYLLVIVTLISVLQNGEEEQPLFAVTAQCLCYLTLV